jgi:hypothetical protein
MNPPRHITATTFGSIALLIVIGAHAPAAASAPRPSVKRDVAKLKSLVLTQADVPEGFSVVSVRSYTPAQIAIQGTWTSAQLKAWGYEGGYEVQFDRALSSDSPAQISSDAGVYKTVAGAKNALAANATACHEGSWNEMPLDQPLGNAAHLCTLTSTIRGYAAQSYFVVWRYGRFKGAVTFTGLQGAVSSADVLALARIQFARMRRVV